VRKALLDRRKPPQRKNPQDLRKEFVILSNHPNQNQRNPPWPGYVGKGESKFNTS
jgi:hypothetical protein